MKKMLYWVSGSLGIVLLLGLIVLSLIKAEPQPLPTQPTQPQPAVPELTFQETTVRFSDAPHSHFGGYGLNKTMRSTQYMEITCFFDPTLEVQQQEQCVEITQKVMTYLGVTTPISIHVYPPDLYNNSLVQDGSIYTYAQNWKSQEYILLLLQAIYGEYAHYGAAYGYASYILQQVFGITPSLCDAQWQYTGDPAALDMNYLCLNMQFFDGKDVKALRRLANTFVSHYIAENGEAAFCALLRQSADPLEISQFNAVLEDFLKKWGIDHAPSTILYRTGGQTYDYIARNPYAIIYIQKDWQDVNMSACPYSYEGILHTNYGDLHQFFTRHTRQMEQYHALLEPKHKDEPLIICFSNSAKNINTYHYKTHSICLRSTGYLMCLYIRALIFDGIIPEAWAYIGLSNYLTYYYDYFSVATGNILFNSPSQADYILEFKANLGRDIDMSRDFAQLFHVDAWAGSADPNDSYYNGAASFVGYLIDRFGEKEVIEILCRTHDFGPFTYDELLQDWKDFLQENYSGYTKYR